MYACVLWKRDARPIPLLIPKLDIILLNMAYVFYRTQGTEESRGGGGCKCLPLYMHVQTHLVRVQCSSLRVRVYVSAYTCVWVFVIFLHKTHICMHTYIHAMYASKAQTKGVDAYMYIYMLVLERLHACDFLCQRAEPSMNSCIHVCVYVYKHTHTYTCGIPVCQNRK
jgi:hypothetical protein